MMMALASLWEESFGSIPGGVTLLPESGEDAGKVQAWRALCAESVTLDYAAEVGCRACASPGGCASSWAPRQPRKLWARRLELALPHTALAPPATDRLERRAARPALSLLYQLDIGSATF